MAPRTPEYEYKTLSEVLQSPPGQYNVYALVLECTAPRPTRGTDHVVNLTVTDPAAGADPATASGVEVVVMGDSAVLPAPHAPGDVIRIHRLKLQHWQGRTQLAAYLGRGKPCAYVLFSGTSPPGAAPDSPDSIPAPPVPYFSSSAAATLTARDGATVSALREFRAALAAESALRGHVTYLKRIADVAPPAAGEAAPGFDLAVLVIAVDAGTREAGTRVQETGTPRVLHVWDGTDAREPAAATPPPPPHLEQALSRAHGRPPPLPPGSALPPLGTILPVVILAEGGGAMPAAGEWAKLRNAIYGAHSKWAPCPPDAAALAAVAARVASHRTCDAADQPSTSWLSRTRHPSTPLSSLRAVVQSTPLAKFRVLARVTGHLPLAAEAFCAKLEAVPARRRPRDGSPPRDGSHSAAWGYAAKLRLGDGTASLDASLLGDSAAFFFGHVPPGDPAEPGEAGDARRAALRAASRRMLTSGPDRRWLEVCLVSYVTTGGAKAFRIVDTELRRD